MSKIMRHEPHQRLEQLLPWYVNGTLEAAERRRLDEHFADCPACRAELEAEQAVAEALRAGAEEAPAPHPQQLERLLERLDEAPEPLPAGAARPWTRLAPRRGARHGGHGWQWLAGLQAAAILVLGFLLARGGPAPAPAYRTLADPPAATAPAGLRVRVVFAPQASMEQVQGLLAQVGAEIVAGPSPLGAYTLDIPRAAEAEPPQLLLAVLRASPAVRFAEPVGF